VFPPSWYVCFLSFNSVQARLYAVSAIDGLCIFHLLTQPLGKLNIQNRAYNNVNAIVKTEVKCFIVPWIIRFVILFLIHYFRYQFQIVDLNLDRPGWRGNRGRVRHFPQEPSLVGLLVRSKPAPTKRNCVGRFSEIIPHKPRFFFAGRGLRMTLNRRERRLLPICQWWSLFERWTSKLNTLCASIFWLLEEFTTLVVCFLEAPQVTLLLSRARARLDSKRNRHIVMAAACVGLQERGGLVPLADEDFETAMLSEWILLAMASWARKLGCLSVNTKILELPGIEVKLYTQLQWNLQTYIRRVGRMCRLTDGKKPSIEERQWEKPEDQQQWERSPWTYKT
jgi:hypothetical protein